MIVLLNAMLLTLIACVLLGPPNPPSSPPGTATAPLGSFRRIFVCGGHSPARTPVVGDFFVLAPCARTRGGASETMFVALRGRAVRGFRSVSRLRVFARCARTLGLSASGCLK